MRRTRRSRIKISDLNANLICVLCGGYYIDATTIIECLHSFCKSCIVRYLETNRYCPICDVQVHKTRPLQNIRSDLTLQHLVYKLVPGLYHNEMLRRREFYSSHSDCRPKYPEDRGEMATDSVILPPEECITVALKYYSTTENECGAEESQGVPRKRYLRCPAAVTVLHLQKLIRAKFGLTAKHFVEILYMDEPLDEDFTLMDVAYVYNWVRKGPMNLTYRIFESNTKRMRFDYCLSEEEEEADEEKEDSGSNKKEQQELGNVGLKSHSDCAVADVGLKSEEKTKIELPSLSQITSSSEEAESSSEGTCQKEDDSRWKEVQIQISESGVMSITDITSDNVDLSLDNIVSTLKTSSEVLVSPVDVFFPDSCEPIVNNNNNNNNSLQDEKDSKKISTDNADVTQAAKGCVAPEFVLQECINPSDIEKSNSDGHKNKEDKNCPLASQLDHKKSDINLNCLSMSDSNSSVTTTKYSGETGSPLGKMLVEAAVLKNPQVDSICCEDKFTSADKYLKANSLKDTPKVSSVSSLQFSGNINSNGKKNFYPNSSPVGYKTLKTPPKSWNPSITRLNYLSSKFQAPYVGNVDDRNINDSVNFNVSIANGTNLPIVSYSSESKVGNGSNQKPNKPPRFFKMRNMPRYLGNPASGVKPMFQISSVVNQQNTRPRQSIAIQNHQRHINATMMKVDPKTLSPIITDKSTSMAPVTSALEPDMLIPGMLSVNHKNASQFSDTQNIIRNSAPSLNSVSTQQISNKLINSANISNACRPLSSKRTVPPSLLSSSASHFLYGTLPPFPNPDRLGSVTRPDFRSQISSVDMRGFHPMSPSVNTVFNPHRQYTQVPGERQDTFLALTNPSAGLTPAVQRIPATNSLQKNSSCTNSETRPTQNVKPFENAAIVSENDCRQHNDANSQVGDLKQKDSVQACVPTASKVDALLNENRSKNNITAVSTKEQSNKIQGSTTRSLSMEGLSLPDYKKPSEVKCLSDICEAASKGNSVTEGDNLKDISQCRLSAFNTSGVNNGFELVSSESNSQMCGRDSSKSTECVNSLAANNNKGFLSQDAVVHCKGKKIIPSV